MPEAYIYDHVRTPRGRGKADGALHEVTALALATVPLQALKERNNLAEDVVDDVILGVVDPVGEAGSDIARFAALKAWRGEVARAHNLPAYVIFHDATLAAIAALAPHSLDDLQGISGIGAKKLEAYGDEVLRVVADP